jgi:hypothetical protein
VDQYARFIDDLVPLVVGKYDGALKAEHGTGRNMAPFVETEWGPEGLAIMRRLKALVDPEHLLNRGSSFPPAPSRTWNISSRSRPSSGRRTCASSAASASRSVRAASSP